MISNEDCEYSKFINFAQTAEEWPINGDAVRKETEMDAELSKVRAWILQGWPRKVEKGYESYFHRKEELRMEEDIVMWGHRVVIQQKLRSSILRQLHESHFGIVKTKNTARTYVYWPGFYAQIEDQCKKCEQCLQTQQLPPKKRDNALEGGRRPLEKDSYGLFGAIFR